MAPTSPNGPSGRLRRYAVAGGCPFVVEAEQFDHIAGVGGVRDPPCRETNTKAAIRNMRSIDTAQATFASMHDGRYGSLSELIEANLIERRLEEGPVAGYRFNVTVSEQDYLTTATPISKQAGRFGYTSNRDAVIRYQDKATATCTPCFPRNKAGAPVR